MAEKYRIICKYQRTTYRNGGTSSTLGKYLVQKKYWFGWATPFWYRWVTAGEYVSQEWRARQYLDVYLRDRGSVTKRVKEVVDTIETE